MPNEVFDSPEIAKLVLRVSFGAMFLLHGIEKIRIGTQGIQDSLAYYGLPASFSYLVFISEIIAPIFLIVGLYTRLSAFLALFTCSLAIFHLIQKGHFFEISQVSGTWMLEPFAVYLFAFMSIMLMGSGKFALRPD